MMLTEPRRICKAHTTSGKPCGRAPISGASVCYNHGGAAPQVRRRAELRLLEMVDPALAQLARIVDNGDTDDVRLKSIKEVLDRANIKPEPTPLTSPGQTNVAVMVKVVSGVHEDDA